MDTHDEHCDLCDLPRSQCIHGRPPPVPKVAAPAPRKRTPARKRPSSTPARPVVRRWTPPEAFRPLILSVLEEAGGELDAEELFLELEIVAEGELRWRYAARRARIALLADGLMTKTTPGVWKLAGPGRA